MRARNLAPRTHLVAFACLLSGTALGAQDYERTLSSDSPAIEYWEAEDDEAIVTLERSLTQRELWTKDADGETRISLTHLLASLDVPRTSQLLVYSKTSLQRRRISPRTPRAIFFNDRLALGYVPGSPLIELAAYDAEKGARFYTLNTRSGRVERPRMCLECHAGAASLGVPGMYVGSVATSPNGRPQYASSIVSDPATPFPQRWGGWYVTGAPEGLSHGGNAVSLDPTDPGLGPSSRVESVAQITRFINAADVAAYAAETSDVVALMVLEHQTTVQNLATRLRWENRLAAAGESDLIPERRLQALVDALVLQGETPLPQPIDSVSPFASEFVLRGKNDSKGRSLRRLNLKTRLFEYRLSYMVATDAISTLPSAVRTRLFDAIFDALVRRHQKSQISRSELETTRKIAVKTIPELPPRWHREYTEEHRRRMEQRGLRP